VQPVQGEQAKARDGITAVSRGSWCFRSFLRQQKTIFYLYLLYLLQLLFALIFKNLPRAGRPHFGEDLLAGGYRCPAFISLLANTTSSLIAAA
jgi:hypothetical protein